MITKNRIKEINRKDYNRAKNQANVSDYETKFSQAIEEQIESACEYFNVSDKYIFPITFEINSDETGDYFEELSLSQTNSSNYEKLLNGVEELLEEIYPDEDEEDIGTAVFEDIDRVLSHGMKEGSYMYGRVFYIDDMKEVLDEIPDYFKEPIDIRIRFLTPELFKKRLNDNPVDLFENIGEMCFSLEGKGDFEQELEGFYNAFSKHFRSNIDGLVDNIVNAYDEYLGS